MHSTVNIKTENMNPLQFISDFTIVSVFQLIFVQQNYRTVKFYSKNDSQSEIFNEIIRNASDSLLPYEHMHIDTIRLERSSYAEPILNVLVVSDLTDAEKRLNRSNLYETTVIWSESQYDDFNDTSSWMKTSSRVIVLTYSNLYALNNLVETKFNKIDLTNFSLTLTSQFLTKFFSISSIKGSSLTIFTEFNAPKCDLTRIGNNYHLMGPDGILAESFAKWLKVKPTFSSSVGLKHRNYQNWLNGSILSLRLRYQYYHPAISTKKTITIFDHKYVNECWFSV